MDKYVCGNEKLLAASHWRLARVRKVVDWIAGQFNPLCRVDMLVQRFSSSLRWLGTSGSQPEACF
jgi:hypothetical protein